MRNLGLGKCLHAGPEVVDQVLTDTRQRYPLSNPVRRQLLRRTNPTAQQDRRRYRRTGGHADPLTTDHFAIAQHHAVHPSPRFPVKAQSIDQNPVPDRQVLPIPNPQQIRNVRRNPIPIAPIPWPRPNARRIRQIVIPHILKPASDTGVIERPLQRLPVLRRLPLNRHRTRLPVKIAALRIRLQPPIVRQHVRKPPLVASKINPRFKISRHPAQRDCPIHRRRSAHHLAPVQRKLTPMPGIRLEPPVMVPPRHPRLQQIPGHILNPRVVRPRLKQQHPPLRILRQPSRNHRTR